MSEGTPITIVLTDEEVLAKLKEEREAMWVVRKILTYRIADYDEAIKAAETAKGAEKKEETTR